MIWNLLTSIFGGGLSTISNDLRGAYEARLKAKNDEDRLAAEVTIEELEAKREIILKAQSDPIERFVRIGFALPFILYTWKLVVYDKVFELGSTDNLSPDLWNIFMIVLAGYFVDIAVRRWRQ